jgi:hypothetical protein
MRRIKTIFFPSNDELRTPDLRTEAVMQAMITQLMR